MNTNLLKAIESKDTDKFNGKLETTESSMENELGKEFFVKQLKKKVRLHGQQMFYVIRQDMRVLNLLDHHHKLTTHQHLTNI